MEIEVQLGHERIAGNACPERLAGIVGAWVEFRGVVRAEEDGRPIAALEYEAYSPMAEQEMRRILAEFAARRPCQFARVIHRVGVVPVGETAVHVGVGASHRAEALALLAEFMDRLKQDVPIWKRRALTELPTEEVAPGPRPGSPRAFRANEVLALLRQRCQPLEAEGVALAGAAGRVLREPVRAPEDQPAFDRSAVDGYAVRLDNGATTFRIAGEIRAGDWKACGQQPGEAVRIATGAALPGEGLQVVMKEDARVEGDTLTVLRRDEERHIRFRGEDAQAGQVLVAAGTGLQPGTLALLASVGVTQPLVTRRPRVLHLATGNEIVPPDQTPQRGQIRDSNSTLVRAFLGQWGIVPIQFRIPEGEAADQSDIRNPKSEIDLLLISGGASVGEHDFTRRWLEQAGFTIHVHKTAARPGKPLIVAQRDATLAFGLPGNPLAHFVCLNVYVRAALEAFSGRDPASAATFQAGVLAEDLPADGHERETFWPARWVWRDGVAALTPLRWRSSGDLTSLATANALIHVAAGAKSLERGSQVSFISTEPES
jgi:molybdopterin molybdotransferase